MSTATVGTEPNIALIEAMANDVVVKALVATIGLNISLGVRFEVVVC